jgi:serine O-acetyltransferase
MEQLYYLSGWLYCHKVPVIPRIIMLVIRLFYQSYIPYKTQIGPGVSFGHAIGVVLAPRSVIGAHCKIRHHVTVADGKGGGARIGDEVEIGAGAFILNNLTIGSRVRIGANAVVVQDVPDDATVVGNPGRVVSIKGKRVA